jgi:predicted DNA-binding protein
MKNSRITVRLTGKLHRRLKDAARRSGKRESEIVRGAVERQFATEDEKITAYERAKEAGLIAAIRGAPRDLSTNQKYFDDFGRS